ncbi:hypothetical protein QBC41DRAFT_356159 [Cercophora samala]|uniref:Uncharacterized protein n=1 Tax=Cercophora samala TaxID=330535 RepID=A0AA39ZDK0_9PEZI|nr:hypothetical protein QBC41DRAFT_356159 [Cercophora samala]
MVAATSGSRQGSGWGPGNDVQRLPSSAFIGNCPTVTMPIPRIAGLRAVGSQRLLLTPRRSSQLALNGTRQSLRIDQQCRLKSTTPPPGGQGAGQQQGQGKEGEQGEGQEKQFKKGLWSTFWTLWKRDMKRGWEITKKTSLRQTWKEEPIGLVVGAIGATLSMCFLAFTFYQYFAYYNSPTFTVFPEDIAFALRKALYFGDFKKDTKRALHYYKQAIELCQEHKLDHFSDEVMGIKLKLADWLEKIDNHRNAIHILENLLSDCQRWIVAFEKAEKEEILPGQKNYKPQHAIKAVEGETPGEVKMVVIPPPPVEEEGAKSEGDAAAQQQQQQPPTNPDGTPIQPKETFRGKRTRLLMKSIGIAVKLASLYSDDHVLERETAHEKLVWAVETNLRELARREKEGLKEGEGKWMTPEEIGGTLESLAHDYQSQAQHHLAVPLLFQALRMCDLPCHTAMLSTFLSPPHPALQLPSFFVLTNNDYCLVSNISTSFAEHPLLPPGDSPVDVLMEQDASKIFATAKQQRAAYLDAAERWAQNAIAQAKRTTGEERTEECDQACATAVINYGSILALQGKPEEARKKFEQAREMIRKMEVEDKAVYEREVEEGLRKLNGEVEEKKGKKRIMPGGVVPR